MAGADRCVAGKGLGWKCPNDEGKARHLCAGHYQQWRRKSPFAPLKGAHGADTQPRDFIGFMAGVDALDFLQGLARERGVSASELYRQAMDLGVAQMRKKG